MAFTLPSLKKPLSALQSRHFEHEFDFEKIEDKEVIGRGGYGIVYKRQYLHETVVVKTILGEAKDDEENFVKEAKLIQNLQHKNVVSFKGFCSKPCAIMLEYVCFDFTPFEAPKKVSNLADFLNYIDKLDSFASFHPKLHQTICRDIAKGLEFLHFKETAHRDLKAKNILVSSQHYCHIKDEQERLAIYQQVPIVCKLADFGESRSILIQTVGINSRTKRVHR